MYPTNLFQTVLKTISTEFLTSPKNVRDNKTQECKAENQGKRRFFCLPLACSVFLINFIWYLFSCARTTYLLFQTANVCFVLLAQQVFGRFYFAWNSRFILGMSLTSSFSSNSFSCALIAQTYIM